MIMQRSKLGLPAGVAAALMYLVGLFGGYLAAIFAAGFILLQEEENFIRRAAVKTLLIMFAYSVLNVLILLLPDIIGIFQTLLAIFRVNFGTGIIDNIGSVFTQILSLMKTAMLLLLAVLAFFGRSIDLKPLSKWADK
jgi:uncharacterized membrane protein